MYRISDFHMHSSFSDDSDATPRSMIERSIALGLPSICFTEHNDFDYPQENGRTIFNIDLPEYIKSIESLKTEYGRQIDIGIGIEQGLVKSVCDRVNSFDSEGRLDFIIGSSHLVNGADPYYPEFWEGFDVRKGILTYYESILENVNVCSNYDVYGHIDYIIRYIPKNRTEEYHEADYHEVIDELLSCIISHGKGIEINTAGFKYGLGQPNPSEFIIKRYRELGGEIITTGSDAHKPEHIAFSFDRLASILKNAGFNYYTTFRKRTPEFIRID